MLLPILSACILLVTSDTHSARFTSRLFDEMFSWAAEGATLVVTGDLVNSVDQWDRGWTNRLERYGFWGVPGNHDDPEGFTTNVRPARVVCGGPEWPNFVGFGIDSERVLGSYGSGFGWARENYPDTPWIIFTHRPFVSCAGREGLGDQPLGRRVIESMPFGSIVVSGHEHVFCQVHMEGWTQLVVSTGGYKKYDCADDLDERFSCERLPDYPTFVRLDVLADDLTIVGLTEGGVVERHMSIIEGKSVRGWE